MRELLAAYIDDLCGALRGIDPRKIEAMAQKILEARGRSRTVFLLGNGGSSATPSHSAGDWTKELGLRATCLSDNTPGGVVNISIVVCNQVTSFAFTQPGSFHPNQGTIGNGEYYPLDIVVDDFESYTDNDQAGEAIWQTWIDGFGMDDNGAQVGYVMPPYAEQAIIHGGVQSMPLFYDNDMKYSEAKKTLDSPRDWTADEAVNLSLWFKGNRPYVGSFVEAPAGTYTMTGSGADAP